jgi:hypothetical protein
MGLILQSGDEIGRSELIPGRPSKNLAFLRLSEFPAANFYRL